MASAASQLRRFGIPVSRRLLRNERAERASCACLLARSLSVSVPHSYFHQWDMYVAKELFRRREQAGPEPVRHRNVWQNWNYDTELFAFGQRLGEKFSADTLRMAFMHPSFAEQEIARRRELMIDDFAQTAFPDQTPLKQIGMDLTESHIFAYVRYNFPYFPEEGVRGVANHLLDPNLVATVSYCLGASDLIMCAEIPPARETLADSLYAVIGALAKDGGPERATYFINDFFITQMLTEDINEYLFLNNPMGTLADILEREGRGEPESRLLRQTGQSTVMAAFLVGIYSDKKLVGESFGETLLVAEDVAARDALRRLFKTDPKHRPWICGDAAKNLPLRNFYEHPNVPLSDWSQKACEENFKVRCSSPSLEEPRRAIR